MRQRRDRRDDVRAIRGAFDGERALPDRGQEVGGIEVHADALCHTETLQARSGKDHRVVLALVELAQAGVDVAAQYAHLDRGIALPQLRLAPQARRADHRLVRKVVHRGEAIADERVARVLALGDRRQREARGHFHRHVLQGMDGEVGFAGAHRRFDLLDEQSLAADRRERPVEDAVALGGHPGQHDLAPRIQRLQPVADVLRLPLRERGLAHGDDKAIRRRDRHRGEFYSPACGRRRAVAFWRAMPVPPTPLDLANTVVRNLVPLGGILFFGWSATNVLILYFVDTMLAMAVMFAGLMRYFMPPPKDEGVAARLNAEAGYVAVALCSSRPSLRYRSACRWFSSVPWPTSRSVRTLRGPVLPRRARPAGDRGVLVVPRAVSRAADAYSRGAEAQAALRAGLPALDRGDHRDLHGRCVPLRTVCAVHLRRDLCRCEHHDRRRARQVPARDARGAEDAEPLPGTPPAPAPPAFKAHRRNKRKR